MSPRVCVVGVCVMLTAVADVAIAAGFSCEMIKEKAISQLCIQDRAEMKAAENAEKERIAEAERMAAATKGAANRESKELDDFVRKSKDALTRSFLDPAAARFSNLIVVTDKLSSEKRLCGSVNGKNSYGAYTGAKMFYVSWKDGGSDGPAVWIEGASTVGESNEVSAMITRDGELRVVRTMCSPDAINSVTKMEK